MTLAPPSSTGGATVTRSASSPATRTDTAAGAAGGPVEAEMEPALQPRELHAYTAAAPGTLPLIVVTQVDLQELLEAHDVCEHAEMPLFQIGYVFFVLVTL